MEPSAEEVKAAVFALLGKIDCDTITRKELTQDLESSHDWNLSNMKGIVKDSLNEFFSAAAQRDEEEAAGSEQESDNDSDEEEEAPAKKKGGGFTKPCQLSAELADFVGCDVLPRTEVVKRMWAYIKANDLQNPKDRREILCDEKLQNLLKRKKVTMFQINKVLSPMIKNISDLQDGPTKKAKASAGSSSSAKPKKAAAATKKKASTSAKAKTKIDGKVPRESNPNAFGGPVNLTAPLQKFLGKDEMLRTEVTQRMWKYIKEKDLQNSENRKEILCDAQLKGLFGVDSFTMFQLSTLLKPMLVKKEK